MLASQLPRDSRTLVAINPNAVWGLQEVLAAVMVNDLNDLCWWQMTADAKGRHKFPRPERVGPKRDGDEGQEDKKSRKKECVVMPLDELKAYLALPRGGDSKQ